MLVSDQPLGTVSVTVLVPSWAAEKVWPPSVPEPLTVVIVEAAAPLKLKLPLPPRVDLLIVRRASFGLVKVQVTLSPAAITTCPAVPPALTVSLPPLAKLPLTIRPIL